MIKIWKNLGLRLLILSAVLAVLSLVALCLVLLIRANQTQEFRQQAAANCQQINLVKSAIRASIDEAEARSLGRDELDAAQRTFIRDYYMKQRARFADDPCS